MKDESTGRITVKADVPAPCCCADPLRRTTFKLMAGAALAAAGIRPGFAAEGGPRVGDWLVRDGDDSKTALKSADLKLNEKQLLVFPQDPKSKAVKDGSRLNRIIVIKLDASAMDEATRTRAADGVLAYSAFCTHQGCDVNAWLPDEKAMLCFCHFSKFAPFEGAAVVGGPASRPLPALPLKVEDGKLVVAGSFTSAPGKDA